MDDNNIRQAAGIQNHSRTLKEDIGKQALKVSAGQNREIPNVIFNKREEKIDKAGHSIQIQRLEQGKNSLFFFPSDGSIFSKFIHIKKWVPTQKRSNRLIEIKQNDLTKTLWID